MFAHCGSRVPLSGTGARSSPCANRCRARAQSSSDNSEPTPTIYFGGNTYSSEEWDDAMDNCQLKDPPVLNESLDEPRHISIRSLMKFDGPAPEIINGRAAMIGWSLAAINEVFGDKGVIAQLCSQPQEVVVIFTLVLVASLFPLGQNVMPHHKEHGIFKAKAELWGGRIAMLGFFVLLGEEALRGGAPVF